MSTVGEEWTVLDTVPLISAPPWLRVSRERVQLPSGHLIDDFYRVDLPDFAVAVPLTPDGYLVLVRGYKHGVGRVCLGAPSGMIDPGEEPQAAAARELLEETGYVAAEWQALGHCVVDANRCCGTAHLFLARDAVQAERPRNPDPGEDLAVELVAPTRFLAAVQSGEVAMLGTAAAVGLALAHGLVSSGT
jgi:ADP-ribose pyrophosphatase